MRLKVILAVACMAIMTETTVQADDGKLAIAGKAGTLGLGGEVSANIFQDLNLRLGVGAFSFDHDSTISDVDYNINVDLLTFPLLVDWYPFHNAFHLSGGIILNETDIDLRAKSSSTVTVGGLTYTASQAGTLYGNVSFNRVAPYVGIGWGNPFGQSRRWGLLCDLGVAFTGSPDVSLSATGPYATDPTFITNLAKEQQDVQDKADNFKLYPVLSLSLYYRF